MVLGSIAIDDRPGQTVYLKYRIGDRRIREVDSEEGMAFVIKRKVTEPIDAPRPNNEQIRALVNVSTMRDAMVPTTDRLEPDAGHAVVTFYRKKDSYDMDLGVWGASGFIGMLHDREAMDVRLPPGEHAFLSGYVGTTLMRAQLEAGKHYYAELDLGTWVLRVKILESTLDQSAKVLSKADWVRLDPGSLTDGMLARAATLQEFVAGLVDKAGRGQHDFTKLGF